MTTLFSTISGQFTKPILIGALFPATLFVVAVYLFVLPMMPWDLQAATRLADLETEWRLAVLGVAAMVIAFFLHILNTPILRLYEGYPWRHGVLGRSRTARARKIVEDARAERTRINAKREELKAAGETEEKSPALQALTARERELILLTWTEYPDAPSVLPTRFGNTLRAFEMYPQWQYRIAAITLWPRFVAKIEEGYAAALDDAKSSVDFALHLALLAKIAFLMVLFLGLALRAPFLSAPLMIAWLLKLVFSALLAWLLYRAAIDRAKAWGTLVRGAFDLYRRPVLEALGVTEMPSDLVSERKIWSDLSRQLAYGDPHGQAPRLRFAAPSLEVKPRQATLAVTRGVTAGTDVRTHHIRLANKGQAPVDGVTVTDTLPAGRLLVWDSVKVGTGKAECSGTNPYVITVGTIGPGKDAVVTYESISD